VVVIEPYRTEAAIRAAIEQMWVALETIGLGPLDDSRRLTVQRQIDRDIAGVDFIQENCPEDLAVKHMVMAELEQFVRPAVVISSSTSSLLASDIQAKCQHPERVLVGHPFNPPHLLPLVEVVAGRQTASDTVDWATEFYWWVGKYPVRVKKEVIGHIANRLTAALYREAVHIVAEGIGSVADVDAVITHGPGLRWALMGPHLTYHLGGGSGGIQHYLEHLGPTQENRWQELGNPRLTDAVKQQIIEGVLAIAGDQSIDDLAQQRDEGLVQLLKLVEQWKTQNQTAESQN